ncbi:MAG: transglycosylase domain-containing protein [Lachnospiraceae bacterium]|nr:transglycosylase domain-containing protein [Lachnospiraceae bacterium]
MAKNPKKIKSHVKRLKLYQQQKPMSPAAYKRKLRIARRKDFFRYFWRVIAGVAIALVVLFFGGNLFLYERTGATLWGYAAEAKEIVENSTEEDFMFAKTSYIYSADGTQLAELSEDTDATFLSYDEIPDAVIDAFVSVEDRTFWTNSGVDYRGIARALINYVRTRGSTAEGGSTITQQLARGVFLTNDKTIERKISEIFIAWYMTKEYSKEDIMTYYCNTCCFANGIYGVEDAANKYFGRSIDELSLSETAYLCAIPNRPEYYNPLKEPANALARRDKILDDMVECGYITEADCQQAESQSVTVADVKTSDTFYNYEVTYAINCAVRYFMGMDGFNFQYDFSSQEEYESYIDTYDEYYAQAQHTLYTGGYEVYTSISLQAQTELQNVLDEQLAFSDAVTDDGVYELQGAITAINNDTGKVTAIIGGRSQARNANIYSLNRAYQGYAQPGSAFKPLAVYTPALNSGYSAYSELRNIDVDEAKDSTSAEISDMYGDEVPLYYAVEQSLNGCAYWLFNEITPWAGLSYVTNMGFSKIMPSDYTLSAALGGLTYGVSTVEMANAYYTLENHGVYTQTDCLEYIYDSNGMDVYETPESKAVYTRDAADEMTGIMEGVIEEGTAARSDWYSYTEIEAAGKTGTTNDNKAGWFCGYTPYYTIAVWVGCDTPKPVDDLQGNTYPLSIWEAAMLTLIDGLPERSFDLSFESSEDWEYEEYDDGDWYEEDTWDTEIEEETPVEQEQLEEEVEDIQEESVPEVQEPEYESPADEPIEESGDEEPVPDDTGGGGNDEEYVEEDTG